MLGTEENVRRWHHVSQRIDQNTGRLQTGFDFFLLCSSLIFLRNFRLFSSSLFRVMLPEQSTWGKIITIEKHTGYCFAGGSCQAGSLKGCGRRMDIFMSQCHRVRSVILCCRPPGFRNSTCRWVRTSLFQQSPQPMSHFPNYFDIIVWYYCQIFCCLYFCGLPLRVTFNWQISGKNIDSKRFPFWQWCLDAFTQPSECSPCWFSLRCAPVPWQTVRPLFSIHHFQ